MDPARGRGARLPRPRAGAPYVEDWLASFDILRLELEEPRELGDHVVVVVRGHGRGRASGVELDNRFCQVWTLRCGTAVRMREYTTREQGLAALR